MHHVIKDILSFQAKNKTKITKKTLIIIFRPLALTSSLIFNVTKLLVVKYNSEPIWQPWNLNSYSSSDKNKASIMFWSPLGIVHKPRKAHPWLCVGHWKFQGDTLRSLKSGLRLRATIHNSRAAGQVGGRRLADYGQTLSVSLWDTRQQQKNKKRRQNEHWRSKAARDLVRKVRSFVSFRCYTHSAFQSLQKHAIIHSW